ncbi:MAG: hypothetical protein GY810_29625 [Aureispira sp.]|nr:hypothetical protein [Aureispira sp.]
MKKNIIEQFISQNETVVWELDEYYMPHSGRSFYWLTDKAFYELSSSGKLYEIRLNNIKGVNYITGWGTMGRLLIRPILKRENQPLETQFIENIKIPYNWIKKQVDSISKDQKESTTKTVVIMGKELEVPKMNTSLRKENNINQKLNKALGEDNVEWLLVYEGVGLERSKALKIILILFILSILVMVVFPSTVAVILGSIGLVFTVLYGMPNLFNLYIPWYYGVTKDRVVQMRSDGKKVKYLTIQSIQDLTFKKSNYRAEEHLEVKTARKRLALPSFGALNELKKMIVDLKDNA